MPKISVVLPFYNREATLFRSAVSVLEQELDDIELLLVDDQSVDKGPGIAHSIACSDGRAQLVRNELSKGAQGARMTGVMRSNSDWVAFLDSDDLQHKTMLERLWREHQRLPDVDVITCFSRVVKSVGCVVIAEGELKWLCNGNISRKILTGECYVDTNGAIIRKSKLIEIGGLDEQCPSFQEWDTHIRLAQVATYATVEEHLVDYYNHSGQMSKNAAKTLTGFLYVLRKHKALWLQKVGPIAYARKCVSLVHLVNQLPNGKLEALRSIVNLHPLVVPFLGEAMAWHLVSVGTASLSKGLRSCCQALTRSV